ncbi:MAG TPA: Tm-1-like ATP-binding domain-containing protein, partial [Opitutaceae bacterium]|nr:Tm-1-like ATP-binding domain-containing protein [Opitutaceae bacterium]
LRHLCRGQGAHAHKGPVQLYLPLKGLSAIGAPGQPFHDAQADAALFSAIREHLRPGIPLFELDAGINDRSFAQACAHGLLELLHKTSSA